MGSGLLQSTVLRLSSSTGEQLIESLANEEEEELVCTALGNDVLGLITDVNGGHVILKLLQCIKHYDRQSLYDGLNVNLVAASNNKQGCCITQKCLEHALPRQYLQLACSVLTHFFDLVMNPYGNYVVSDVLDRSAERNDLRPVNECAHLVASQSIMMVQLCTNKFSP